jgi:hypothetical protein
MMSHNGTSLLDGLAATEDGSAALVKMTRDRVAGVTSATFINNLRALVLHRIRDTGIGMRLHAPPASVRCSAATGSTAAGALQT